MDNPAKTKSIRLDWRCRDCGEPISAWIMRADGDEWPRCDDDENICEDCAYDPDWGILGHEPRED